MPLMLIYKKKKPRINDILPSIVLTVLDIVDVIGCSAGVLLAGLASLGLYKVDKQRLYSSQKQRGKDSWYRDHNSVDLGTRSKVYS